MTRKARLIAVVGVATVVVCAAIAAVTAWQARRALRQASAAVDSENNFGVVTRAVSLDGGSRFETLASPAVFTGGAIFDGHLYLCGPGGLFEYGDDGKLVKAFRVGRELPAAPVTALATGTLIDGHGPELLMGTRGAGVLAWDGAHLRQILAEGGASKDANTITALLPLGSGWLLIGTAKVGVLLCDGQHIRYFHSTLKKLYVTALAGDESEVWVGTQGAGVYHWQGGEAEQITEAEDLPDAHVNAIAQAGGVAYVATPAGVAEVVQGRVQRVLAKGVFAQAVAVEGQTLAVGSFDEGFVDVPLAGGRRDIRPLFAAGPLREDPAPIEQMFSQAGTLYAVARNEVYVRRRGQGWKAAVAPEAAMLTDSNVSALAVDEAGKLWVGYFDRGLDILSAAGERVSHIEDDHVYCVNRIVPDGGRHTVDVATANGLAVFDVDGKERAVMGKRAGLIAEDATDVALYRGGMAVSTPAGITFVDDSGAHSLYAFEGLVNNHVYTLAMQGDRLLAGTLGGLSILDDGHVTGSLTTANSGLQHNWINAVVPVSDGWLMGTYGAGVEHMDLENHVEPTEATRVGVDVNPNAMLVTANHVLAGTLGDGLMVLNRRTGRWKTITQGLPSLNVTSFAASGDTIYIGTEDGLVKVREERLDE